MSTSTIVDKPDPDKQRAAAAADLAVLSPVDRVSEMLFGLLMALTFIGAVSAAESGNEQIHTLFTTALGCNLAWGLVDAVMHLVRTITERGRLITLVRSVREAPDAAAGRLVVEQSLSRVAAGLVSATEIEAVRGRILVLPALPPRPHLGWADVLAAFKIFVIVVVATFPVVLPFLLIHDVVLAKNVSRGVSLLMLFLGGLALGRYAGYGSWKAGLSMAGLGAALVVAINALGG
jgi:hypothetical protein